MIEITVTGDFCPVNQAEKLISERKFDRIFNNLLPLFSESDLSITNLECPLINEGVPISKTGPSLKGSPDAVFALSAANIGLVTLANNHIMDYGQVGLQSTIKTLQDQRIRFTGAGNNLSEARNPEFIKIKGKNLSIINISENEFSTTHGTASGTNPHSIIANYYDLKEAKLKSDYVIVIYHGGNEHYNLPSPRVKETFRFFVEAGADAVIAHHTHCYSGYEIYNGKPILYGLGNFIFDFKGNRGYKWERGLAVKLKLDEKSINFEIIPITQFSDNKPGAWLLEGDEKETVLNDILQLNEIIQNDDLLKNKFLQFIKLREKEYRGYLEPYTNKYLYRLFKRGLIPSLISRKKEELFLNLVRCESHRDVILELLK